MAGLNYHAHPYIRQLNDYHAQLLSCSQLSAHLLDEQVDSNVEEWQKAGCWLMRDMLLHLAENLPFPPEEAMKLDAEVEA